MAGDRLARAARRRLAPAALGALAALALAACDAPSVGAPDVPDGFLSGTGGATYRWDYGRRIAVFADTVGQRSGVDLRGAVARAAGLWNAVPAYGDFTLVRVDDVHDADVIVHYLGAPLRVNLYDCAPPGGGAGRTTFCPDRPVARVLPFLDGSAGHVKVDVYVDPFRYTDADLVALGLTRTKFLDALVTHELGHVVGIGGHFDTPDDLMTSRIIRVDAPTPRDEAALRAALRMEPDVRL